MLSDRNFRVEINGKSSRKRVLNNGLPQGSVLASFLYCVYTMDLPRTNSRKFIYVDDNALASQAKTFEEVETKVNEDLEAMSKYFKDWRLKPNTGKTVHCLFHLNNRETRRTLDLKLNGETVEYEANPQYLGNILDRSLTYRPNLENIKSKLKSRVNIIQKLAGTTWGCSAKTLKISSQAMVISTSDFCSPVWMNSVHTNKVDTQINRALRIVSGAVDPTEVEWLYVLSNVAPPQIARQEAALRECRKIEMDSDLPIFKDIASAPTTLRLQSRNPFWRFYQQRDDLDDLTSRWKEWWQGVSVANKQLVTDPTIEVKGNELPRKIWLRLNRFRTGQGCCAFLMHRWNFTDSPLCQCGQIQTMEHILNQCNIHRFTGDINDLNGVTNDAIRWLNDLTVQV